MNLAKLFDFKYFMQNIKKSKMAIILFLTIVPIFTALTIITISSSGHILEYYELGLANIFFMYITPFVLSFSLFGYVYKKKSIDFIGSMPISRKSIFVTNTVGGIVLLILSQLVTLLVSMLMAMFTNMVIFPKMLLDIFIYQSIAYIFVFAVSNLAMSVSGNVLTQIVVTLLILFVIPVSVFYSDLWGRFRYDLVDGDYNLNYTSVRGVRNYTAPSFIFGAVISGEAPVYNSVSIIKMIVLSIAYAIVGYYMFKNKKMEYAGESFENRYVHLAVKGLTTIPLVMILVVLVNEGELEGLLFLIAVIAVYYLIYDLITNKKNKITVNLIAMIVSTLVLFGTYTIIANVSENLDRKIDIQDIKAVTIQDIGYQLQGLNYEIKDKELIEKIIYSNRNSKEQAVFERVELELKTSNGSKKYYSTRIESSLLNEILKSVGTEEYYNIEVNLNNIKLSKAERKNLKIAVNNAIKEKGSYNLYSALKADSRYLVYGYEYKNHRICKLTFDINISDDVFNIVSIAENKSTAEYVRKRRYDYMYLSVLGNNGVEYHGACTDEIKNYVTENKDKICNKNIEYIILHISGNKFFTNDIETVKNMIKNAKGYKEYEENNIYYNLEYDKYPQEISVDSNTIYDTESVY